MVRFSISPWTDQRPIRSIALDSNVGLAATITAPGHHSPDQLLLTLAPYADTPPYSIEAVYFCTINQIESTDK